MIDGQVVLVPVLVADESKNFAIVQKLTEMRIRLETAGIRCHIDDRRHVRHGAKYFEWERKGVPIRLELGMRDISNNVVVLAPRVDTAATLPDEVACNSGMNSMRTRHINKHTLFIYTGFRYTNILYCTVSLFRLVI
jgi:prolyl-tRNA synthetase